MRKTIQLNIILNLFCLLITSQYIYGQDENQSWTKITFEKKLPYSLKFEFSQGLRLKEELSVINLAFFEGAISYKTSKGFKVDIPYRYTIFEDKIKHRLSFGASYQYTIKPIALKYRIKYYRLYEEGESISEDGEAFGDLVRNKFIDIPLKRKNSQHTYHQYVIKVHKNRNKLIDFLKMKKIDTSIHYPKMITFLATNLEKNRNGRKGLKNNIYNIYYD